jgi:hypothetical protein
MFNAIERLIFSYYRLLAVAIPNYASLKLNVKFKKLEGQHHQRLIVISKYLQLLTKCEKKSIRVVPARSLRSAGEEILKLANMTLI